MKALKVTISGSYKGHEDKTIDFSNVTGIIPFQEEEIAAMHIRRRYARMWIMNDPKYREHIKKTRECYIDNMEVIEHDFSFVGKDIREMNFEELQDLATAKDLRLVPLYKKTSEREARMVAYADYSEQVLKEKVNYRAIGFNLTKQPPIIVNDSAWRKDTTKKTTNEEELDAEADRMAGKMPKVSLSRVELENIAVTKNVHFNPNDSDQKLYERLYG